MTPGEWRWENFMVFHLHLYVNVHLSLTAIMANGRKTMIPKEHPFIVKYHYTLLNNQNRVVGSLRVKALGPFIRS